MLSRSYCHGAADEKRPSSVKAIDSHTQYCYRSLWWQPEGGHELARLVYESVRFPLSHKVLTVTDVDLRHDKTKGTGRDEIRDRQDDGWMI